MLKNPWLLLFFPAALLTAFFFNTQYTRQPQAIGDAKIALNTKLAQQPQTQITIAVDLVGKVFASTTSINLANVSDPNAVVKPRSHVGVKYTIENKGLADSGPVRVRFYLSHDEMIDSAADKLLKVINGTTFLDETVVANVVGNNHLVRNNPNGAGGTVTLELPDGTDLFWLNDRTYYIGMVIDPVSPALPTGKIEETGERDANNQPTNAPSNNYNQALGKDKQAIDVTNTQIPNLQILQLNVANTELTRTSSSKFTYTVRNDGKRSTQGIVPSVDWELRISDRPDLTFENIRTQGERVFLDDINNGGPIAGLTTLSSQTGTFSLASVNSNYWEARADVRQYYLYAFVDPNEKVGESNESDNLFKTSTVLTINP
jgi:hypothetical protein